MSIYIDNVETEFLPLNCNWIASNLLPKFDENNNTFVEPFLPNNKIGIMHLAAGIWDNKKDMRIDSSVKIQIQTLENKNVFKKFKVWSLIEKKIKFQKIGLINKEEIFMFENLK